MNRREALSSVVLAVAGSGLLPNGVGSAIAPPVPDERGKSLPANHHYVEGADGTLLFCQDWGEGQPILFIHGLALSSEAWRYNMLPLSERGFRSIAYDRRGHGRSTQPWRGYDYDSLADDLASVINHFDLSGLTLVAHSMGGGEVVRYLSRHGTERVARIVFVAPSLPFTLKTLDHPEGVEKSALDQLRSSWYRDFPKWVADNTPPFFTPGTSQAQMQWGISLTWQTSLRALTACHHALTETDFRREVAAIALPTLILQGDKDASCQIDFTGRRTAKLIKDCQFKVYPGAPHGLIITHADQVNTDLAQFVAS